MSQTVVIEQVPDEKEQEVEAIRAKYEEILSRFAQTDPPSPREKVFIERKIIQTFHTAIAGEEIIDSKQRNKTENIADAVTAISTVLSTIASVNSVANSGGYDLSSLASSLMAHSIVLFGSVSGLSTLLLSVVSLWNVYSALQTGKKIKSVHDNFVRWDKYYMNELDKAQASVEHAVAELASYFVTREAKLRMKDPTQTSMIEYELGMQMTRCMSQVEYKLRRYQTLIDKAEQTLAQIEHNAVELEGSVHRQKRRAWLAVVVGGITVVGGIATIVATGGAAIPIATAILGGVTMVSGGFVIHLSRAQLETLGKLRGDVNLAKKQLEDHKKSCQEFEEEILGLLRQANEYVTEAEKDAAHLEERDELLKQLAEARAQNGAVGHRLSAVCGPGSDAQRQIYDVLTRYRLEKYCDALMDLGIDGVEDLEMLDADTLTGTEFKPIIKKRILKMASELRTARLSMP